MPLEELYDSAILRYDLSMAAIVAIVEVELIGGNKGHWESSTPTMHVSQTEYMKMCVYAIVTSMSECE